MASAFVVEDLMQTNMFVWIYTNHGPVCLDMHCYCLFDNWLCDLIPENWQLTLGSFLLVVQSIQLNIKQEINLNYIN